jgi:hypothetical protein
MHSYRYGNTKRRAVGEWSHRRGLPNGEVASGIAGEVQGRRYTANSDTEEHSQSGAIRMKAVPGGLHDISTSFGAEYTPRSAALVRTGYRPSSFRLCSLKRGWLPVLMVLNLRPWSFHVGTTAAGCGECGYRESTTRCLCPVSVEIVIVTPLVRSVIPLMQCHQHDLPSVATQHGNFELTYDISYSPSYPSGHELSANSK